MAYHRAADANTDADADADADIDVEGRGVCTLAARSTLLCPELKGR